MDEATHCALQHTELYNTLITKIYGSHTARYASLEHAEHRITLNWGHQKIWPQQTLTRRTAHVAARYGLWKEPVISYLC